MATVVATETGQPPPRRRFVPPAVFGLVPEGAVRRRPSDVVKVVLTAAAIFGAAWLARHPGDFGRWTFEVVTDVPGGAQDAFRFVYLIGSLTLIAAVTFACLVRRRVRLALSMIVGALVAWILALGLLGLVDAEDARDGAGLDAFGNPPEFPAVRLAAAFCVLFVVLPYLTRPAARLLALVLLACSASAVLSVEGLFSDVLGSMALGWGVAALVHLTFGSPAGTPSTGQVTDSLRDFGLHATDLRLVPGPWYWSQYDATLDDGSTVAVSVIGRDARDARVFGEIWRSLWYKGSGADLVWSRRRQVEHWAYLLLVAARAGAGVPDVVAAGVAGRRDDALLVVRDPQLRSLEQVEPAQVTDDLLDATWAQLTRLANAHVAKGGLRASEVLVTADSVTALRDFSQASYPASPATIATDALDWLVVSARIVGVDRAVDAALRVLGKDGLTVLLSRLQPAALSRGTRRDIGHDRQLVKDLREKAAAVTVGEAPKLAELRRVSLGDVLMCVGTLVGVYLLVGQFVGLSGIGNVFETAEWQWVAVAFLLSQLPQIAAAFGLTGSVMAPLPFGPVVGVQYANNFTGLVGGSVANIALIVRFLQKQGQPAAVAVSSSVLNSVASGVMEIVLVPLTAILSGSSFSFGDADGSSMEKLLLLAIVVVGALTGFVLFFPALRRKVGALVRPQWDAAKGNIAEVMTRPRKAAQLFGSKFVVEILFGLVLWASVHAYGGDVGLVQLIFINCVASIIGGAAPVPGGMGVIEAGLIAGLTAAGLSQEEAVAATFTHRLFTCYLPPIWGWFALAWLKRREYI